MRTFQFSNPPIVFLYRLCRIECFFGLAESDISIFLVSESGYFYCDRCDVPQTTMDKITGYHTRPQLRVAQTLECYLGGGTV